MDMLGLLKICLVFFLVLARVKNLICLPELDGYSTRLRTVFVCRVSKNNDVRPWFFNI